VAQLFSLGHFPRLTYLQSRFGCRKVELVRISMRMSQIVRMVLARAGFVRRASAEPSDLPQTFCLVFI
jgi:hypothetical protein